MFVPERGVETFGEMEPSREAQGQATAPGFRQARPALQDRLNG
jgi:hypothetical protein